MAGKVPTLEDLLLRLPPALVDQVCSDEHLLRLTSCFSEWINISTYLGLTKVQQRDIEINWPRDVQRQRSEMFTKWKENKGENATYRSLVQAFYITERRDVIDDLCKITHIPNDKETKPSQQQSMYSQQYIIAKAETASVLSAVPKLQRLTQLHDLASTWYVLGEELNVKEENLEMIDDLCDSDDLMCMEKMFGVWLRECNSPTYRKLIAALIDIGERTIANVICEEQGITLDQFVLDNDEISKSTSSDPLSLQPFLAESLGQSGTPHHTQSGNIESFTSHPQVVSNMTMYNKLSLAHKPLSKSLPPPPLPPECVKKYAAYLRKRYKRISALPTPKWPPTVKEAVKLALIEKEIGPDSHMEGIKEKQESMEWDYLHGKVDNIVAVKKGIELVDVFMPEITATGDAELDVPLKILMDGAPGVGKTTLTRKACIDWANGEILQDYHIVVLVPLREAKNRKATCVKDLLPGDSPTLIREVTEHIQDTSGKHTLLILDGFDELSAEEREQESLFLDLIQSDCLSECTVLVTSRPYASDSLLHLESVNRHVEVLGFTEKQISDCITHNIADNNKALELISRLHERLDIASLCYIPLNCAIVMYVYQQKGYVLPKTLTELFSDFIYYCIKRQVTVVKKDEHLRRQLSNSRDQLPEKLAMQLDAVSKLAYNGLIEDKLVFQYKDLLAAFPLHTVEESGCSIESYCLGLMSSTTMTLTDEIHYQFLHLSIQEFLAAKYVHNNLTGVEQFQFFCDHLQNKRFRLMLLFLAGLTKFNIPSPEEIFSNFEFKHGFLVTKTFLYLAQLVFESQAIGLYTVLVHHLIDLERFNPISNELTIFDCILIGHCLCSVDHSWKTLNLSDCSLSNRCVTVFNEVQNCYRDFNSSRFERIFLNQNRCDILRSLPSLLWLSHAKELHCAKLVPGTNLKPMVKLPTTVDTTHSESETHIEYESAAQTEYSASVGEAYKKLLETNVTLKVLDLHSSSVSDIIVEGIAAGLIKNSSLTTVDLDENTLSYCTIKCILSSLNLNRSIHSMKICGVTLSRALPYYAWDLQVVSKENIQQFSFIDLCLNSLQKLSLCSSFHVTSNVSDVFETLKHNTNLEVLKLSGFEILAADYIAMTKSSEGMQRVLLYSQIKILDLTGCTIDELIITEIFSLFNLSTSLCNVHICDTSLSRENSHSIWNVYVPPKIRMPQFFSALRNSSLKTNLLVPHKLDVSHASITSSTATDIFHLLQHCVTLEELDLSDNTMITVGDSEAVGCAIKDMLTKNSTLKILDLHGGSANDDIVRGVSLGVINSVSLKLINLDDNSLSDDVVTDFLSAAHSSTSLRQFRICWTHFLHVQPHGKWTVEIRQHGTEWQPRTARVLQSFGAVENSPMRGNVHWPWTISNLNFSGCHLTSSSAVIIFKHLITKYSADFNRLDLSGNHQLAKNDSEAVSDEIKKMLEVNKKLKVLDLHGGSANDMVAQAITDGLVRNSTLKEINLDDNELSENIVTNILSSANLSCSLCELHVCGVCLKRSNCRDIWKVTSKLETTVKSDEVQKKRNKIKFFSALANSSVIKPNIQIQTLNLSDAFITGSEAVVIFQLLKNNTTLKELDLSGNRLLAEGDSEAISQEIKNMLEVNKKLELLDLHGGSANDMISKAIAGGLIRNSTLQKLNLDDNKLSENTVMDILSSVEWSHSLHQLHICGVFLSFMYNYRGWLITFKHDVADVLGKRRIIMFLSALGNSSMKTVQLKGQSTFILNLSDAFVTSSEATGIFQLLKKNANIKELNLSGNMLLPEGCSETVSQEIKKMLEVNETLEVLDLHGGSVNDMVAKAIADGLLRNSKLRVLNLNDNKLSENIVTDILSSVNLSHSLRRVNICGVYLSRSSINRDIWIVQTSNPKATVKSDKVQNKIKFLSALTNSLMKPKIEMQTLNLSDAFVTCSEAAVIFQLLKELNVKELNLSGNMLLPEGCSETVSQEIKKMLEVNETLEVLDLHGGSANDMVAKAIADGLTRNSKLRVLNLSDNKLSENIVTDILSSVNLSHSLRHVYICGVYLSCSSINRDIWFVQTSNPKATVKSDKVQNKIKFLSALTNSLIKPKIQIQTLNLSDAFVTCGEAVVIFQLLKELNVKQLDLSGNRLLTEGDSERISQEIKKMLEVNETLEILDLHGGSTNDMVAKAIADGLMRNSTLKEMNLDDNELSENIVTDILSSANLSRSLCRLHVCGVCLKRSSHHDVWLITFNEQRKNLITKFKCDVAMQRRTNFLYAFANSSMENILRIKCITGSDAVIVFKFLEYNTTIEVLDLSSVVIQDHSSAELEHAIQKMLETNTTLKILNFNYTPLTSVTLHCIALGLINTSLKKLYMSATKTTRNEAEYIFHSLEQNTSLEELDLSKNSLAEENGIIGNVIETMFRINRTLVYLKLARCNLLSLDMYHLFQGLQQNSSLKQLDISYNYESLEWESSIALAEMLLHNKKLNRLNIARCWMPRTSILVTHWTLMSSEMELVADTLLKDISLQILLVDVYEGSYLSKLIQGKTTSLKLMYCQE